MATKNKMILIFLPLLTMLIVMLCSCSSNTKENVPMSMREMLDDYVADDKSTYLIEYYADGTYKRPEINFRNLLRQKNLDEYVFPEGCKLLIKVSTGSDRKEGLLLLLHIDYIISEGSCSDINDAIYGDTPAIVELFGTTKYNILKINCSLDLPEEEKYITTDGKDVVLVNGYPIAADAKMLRLDADQYYPEDYTYGYYGYDSMIWCDYKNGNFDIKELVEKSPQLEILNIASNDSVDFVNISEITKLKNLKELHIRVDDYNDLSWLEDIKLEKLYLYKLSAIPDVELKVSADEVIATYRVEVNDDFKYSPNLDIVSDLEINLNVDKSGGLDGIEVLENLPKLKKLTFNTSIDVAKITCLDNLEELRLQHSEAINLDKVTELKSLKKLTLNNLTYHDLSFLEEMPYLEEFTFSTKSTKIPPMPNFNKVENLKSLCIDIVENDSIASMSCSNFGELTGLENLALYNISITDISQFENLIGLKSLTLSDVDITEKQAREIIEYLPNCKFKFYDFDNV